MYALNFLQGNRTTPSYVGFTDSERLIGDAAKNQVAMNPNNTVFDAKRLIGRKYDDPAVAADKKHWPFEVIFDSKSQTPRCRDQEIFIKLKSKANDVR